MESIHTLVAEYAPDLVNPSQTPYCRELDLIVNPEVKSTFIKRSKILTALRDYLDGSGIPSLRNMRPTS